MNRIVTKINAKNKKEFTKLISQYRDEGYFLITFGYSLAELEKGNNMIVIKRG